MEEALIDVLLYWQFAVLNCIARQSSRMSMPHFRQTFGSYHLQEEHDRTPGRSAQPLLMRLLLVDIADGDMFGYSKGGLGSICAGNPLGMVSKIRERLHNFPPRCGMMGCISWGGSRVKHRVDFFPDARLNRGQMGRFSGRCLCCRRTHPTAPCKIRLRTIHRLDRANITCSWWVFLASPR